MKCEALFRKEKEIERVDLFDNKFLAAVHLTVSPDT